MEGYQHERGRERIGEKVQGLRSIIGRYKNRQGEVKNSTGNGKAKELTCTTYEHEIRGGYWREGVTLWRGAKGKILGQL